MMLAATVSNLLGPRMRVALRKPVIENIAFKLHYQLTVTLLLAAVILVCSRDYFGESIKCMTDAAIPPPLIEKYCFFMATFTIVRHYNESLLQGGFLPHPGVGPIAESDEFLNHTYYQWVPFVLFIQSLAFYMPHYIWKKKEVKFLGPIKKEPDMFCKGGRIKALVDGLQYASLALTQDGMSVAGMDLPSKETLSKRIDIIRRDIKLRLRISRTWSVWLVSMEVLNLLHVIFEIWIINKFLNGHFIGLGPSLLNYNEWSQIADPLETVFPKVTKCIFHKYGPSGSIQQHDALCVMALNIIHEKIYAVLWFWLLILFIVSVLAVIWRIISFYLYRRSPRFNTMMFQRATKNDAKFDPYNVIEVVNGCQFADWLFLYYLAKNMQGVVFKELFTRLAEELGKRDMPDNNEEDNEKKGAEPILLGHVSFDDETLPLKPDKKST